MTFEGQASILHVGVLIQRFYGLILETTAPLDIKSLRLRPLVQIVVADVHGLVHYIDQLGGTLLAASFKTLQAGQFCLLQGDFQAMFVVRFPPLVSIPERVGLGLVELQLDPV